MGRPALVPVIDIDMGVDIGEAMALGCNGGFDDSIGCWNVWPPDMRSWDGGRGCTGGDITVFGEDMTFGDENRGIPPLAIMF